MKLFVVLLLFGFASVYGFPCTYTISNGADVPPYILNLTEVSEWTLELQEGAVGLWYYYTPCRNGLQCRQGSSNFYTNAAQFKPGSNECEYYLSVDHHDQPTYSHTGASFAFRYTDGELCEITQQPRETTIYWTCAVDGPAAYMDRVQEMSACNYHITIESNLACVPENQRNANCQYSIPISQTENAVLNLAPLRDIDPLRFDTNNGYRYYYSPCKNGIHCYQQTGQYSVMSVIDNVQTGTCERYTGVWENGRHIPNYIGKSANNANEYFEFRYYNGEPCQGGVYGSEERITYICDETVDTAKTINVTSIGPCRIDFFVATKLACQTSYDKDGNLIVS